MLWYDKSIKSKEEPLMDKLTSTARKIDIVFKIADIMLKIAFVACLVCIGIVTVGKVFNLPDEMIGTVDQLLEFGPLTLTVADSFTPDFDRMLIQAAAMLALGAACSFIGILCVKTVRAILAPMKEGKPFASEISKNLRKLGWLSLVLGVAVQVMEAVSLFSLFIVQDMEALLISEKITHVDVNASFDLSVLIIPAVFFLLAYVFKYGEQLQTLSDETL
jgi:hypothetical protein